MLAKLATIGEYFAVTRTELPIGVEPVKVKRRASSNTLLRASATLAKAGARRAEAIAVSA